MFRDYLATKDDFHAVEVGLAAVEKKELDFVFTKRDLLKDIVVISYDSSNLYIWTKIKFSNLSRKVCPVREYYAYKIPHSVKLNDDWQTGWRVGLPIKLFNKLLPKKLRASKFETPIISGGLLKPFITLQRKKELTINPYVTRDSYLATIVHEFAHIYWNQNKLWWYSSKEMNMNYLKIAEKLYGAGTNISDIDIHMPANLGWSELFAYCVE